MKKLIVFFIIALTIIYGFVLTLVLHHTYDMKIYMFYNILSLLYIPTIIGMCIIMSSKDRKRLKGGALIFVTIIILTCVGEMITNEDVFVIDLYEYLIVDSNKPSIFNYQYSMLKDSIKNETTFVTTKDFEVYSGDVFLKGGRRTRSFTEVCKYYVKFIKDDRGYKYSSEVEFKLYNIVSKFEELGNEITIEYYNNTGIIKSIDGIEKSDYEKLDKRLEYLIEQQVAKEREEGVEYSIKYLSSRLYRVGEVAFEEKLSERESVLYIVKDHNIEDMIKMPRLTIDMLEDEAIKVLQESGFNYRVARVQKAIDAKGKVIYCPYATDTLLPKGLEVEITVNI